MKQIIIFYSRSGNTKKLAAAMAQALACDIEELEDTEKRSGLGGWIRSGKQAMKEVLTTLQPIKKDLSQYDLVIVGGPVWAGRISVPVRTFISQNKDKLKDVAFFYTSGGKDNEPKIFPAMEQLCGKKPKATLGCQTVEVKKDKYKEKLHAFVVALAPK
jgi:menaquinone-dependent protoporphyrinogen IX oxidase